MTTAAASRVRRGVPAGGQFASHPRSDGDPIVLPVSRRELVESIPSSDRADLSRTAQSPDARVRHAVAAYPHTPGAIVDAMLDSEDDAIIRLLLIEHPNIALRHQRHAAVLGTEQDRLALARNRHISPSLAVEMCRTASDAVRRTIRLNPNATAPMLAAAS